MKGSGSTGAAFEGESDSGAAGMMSGCEVVVIRDEILVHLREEEVLA